MYGILLAFAAALACGLLVAGWRMSRSTGLEDITDAILAEDRVEKKKEKGPGPLVRLSDWLGLGLQRTLLSFYGPVRLRALDQRLDRAGRPEGLTARDFVRRQAGMIGVGVIAGVAILLTGQPLLAVVIVLVLALTLPVWLRSAARARQDRISRELPDFLDVLAVTVAAGLSLQSAMERVVEADDRPLSQEIRRVLEDMRLGKARRAALTALRDRNDSQAIGSWVTAMLQAEELGSPLSGALNDIAAEIRREAAQIAKRKAARTSPQVSLVVTFTIMPGALLLIVASLLLSNLDALKGLW